MFIGSVSASIEPNESVKIEFAAQSRENILKNPERYLVTPDKFQTSKINSKQKGDVYYIDKQIPHDCIGTYSIARRDCNGNDGSAFKFIATGVAILKPSNSLIIRDGVYREQVSLSNADTSASAGINISSYQNEYVEINAAEPILQWTKCENQLKCHGNVFWKNVVYSKPGFPVTQLFQNGKKLSPSRYPNQGWVYPNHIDPQSHNIFSIESPVKFDGYFNNATAHIKTTPYWLSDIAIVNSFSNGKLVMAEAIAPHKGSISSKYGLFLTNIIEEINEPGEWAYDKQSKRLYFWPNNGLVNIEASKRDFGIRLHDGDYFKIQGLHITYPKSYGIWLHGASNNTVINNSVLYAYNFGIFVQGGFSLANLANNNLISGNHIKFANYRGISNDSKSHNIQIENNYIYATGVENFGDDLLHGVGEGIFVEGGNAKIINNVINRSAYSSIYINGSQRSNKEIAFNIILNSNLALSDGAGIYAGGKSLNKSTDKIHHNILINMAGYVGGIKENNNCKNIFSSTICGFNASGIYIDEQGNNFLIEHNTVVNANKAGIYYHWAQYNRAENNVLYDNNTQLWLSGKNEEKFILTGNYFNNNIFYATNATQKTVFIGLNYQNFDFGESNNNIFVNKFEKNHIGVLYYVKRANRTNIINNDISLAEWKILANQDKNSIESMSEKNFKSIKQQPDSMIVINAFNRPQKYEIDSPLCDIKGHIFRDFVLLPAYESKVLQPCNRVF